MQYPLKTFKLGLLFNAPYGSPLRKILGEKHLGVDLLPKGDDELRPMDDGVVTVAVMGNTACGGQIDIEYQGGAIKSRYCHLDKLYVNAGMNVSKASIVGLQGRTGTSYPRGFKHTHWVTWKLGGLVDPLSLVQAETPTLDLINQVNSLFRSVWGRQPVAKESHYFQKRVADGIKKERVLLDKMKYWKAQPRFKFIWEMQKAGFF